MRLDAGLTQASLSEAMDYDQTYISAVERGIRPPSWTYLVAFADALKVNLLSLLRDAGFASDDTVSVEQEIATLIEEVPEFAEIFEVGRELERHDKGRLRSLVEYAKWLVAQMHEELARDEAGGEPAKPSRDWRIES